ncbi:MAG: hypothetical protein HQM00_12930 [Magnetococcales bacterium]|nr:hypothetical protein [Magnetococcales bacterium]
MGKSKVQEGNHADHQLEEEIGVEVKKMLRSEMSGSVAAMERELTEEEQQLFSDAYLGTAVELMIPSAGQERRLMARLQETVKLVPVSREAPRKASRKEAPRKASRKEAPKKKTTSKRKKR